MLKLPDGEVSYWIDSTERSEYRALADDIDTDVVVVGGGIAGLTCAYLLSKSGKKVVVIEKDAIGSGVTGHTTGKVTSQHSVVYSELYDRLGKDEARLYGEANQTALTEINRIIKREKIDCDWQKQDNYVFSERPEDIARLKKEARIAGKLGLPATFTAEIPLPLPMVRGAVRFASQARFHPNKYLLGLTKAIVRNGGLVFEKTKAKHIRDGHSCIIATDSGTLKAKDVVIATNVPFPWLAHGYYCAFEYPLKSYIIACRTNRTYKGMYITPGRQPFSILPIKTGRKQLLLVGGASHVPGLTTSVAARFERLAKYAYDNFSVDSIEYKWSARDYLGYDDKPLAGKLYPWSRHVYTLTGFMKWGLTNATAASMIVCDSILGNKNPWAPTFSTLRSKPVLSIPHTAGKYFS
ncbi:MAG TPA: FAD-binding oxidoreductase [Candidatus Saccharimonadales bacterium]|nr:FAD-binding oxidoreductase [Candidatus Saccharimonadales bacterium]